jgi:small subunit ribosomal protein S4e
MVRGPKRHLKRLHAPKKWMLDKLGGIWAPKPSAGPHKARESMPLIVILRNRLKYALTARETNLICMQKLVKVDGKVRTDKRFPAGFQDVITMEKSGDNFRVMFDTKGRFVLHPVDAKEASFKLCRVEKQALTTKGVPYIVTHDGRTIRYHDPLIKVGDTIKLDIESGKPVDIVKFGLGAVCMITKGRNSGRVGILTHRDRHPGSFDIVHIKDREGNEFATRLSNVFVLGSGTSPLCELPKGQGVKRTIFEQRAKLLKHARA